MIGMALGSETEYFDERECSTQSVCRERIKDMFVTEGGQIKKTVLQLYKNQILNSFGTF